MARKFALRLDWADAASPAVWADRHCPSSHSRYCSGCPNCCPGPGNVLPSWIPINRPSMSPTSRLMTDESRWEMHPHQDLDQRRIYFLRTDFRDKVSDTVMGIYMQWLLWYKNYIYIYIYIHTYIYNTYTYRVNKKFRTGEKYLENKIFFRKMIQTKVAKLKKTYLLITSIWLWALDQGYIDFF